MFRVATRESLRPGPIHLLWDKMLEVSPKSRPGRAEAEAAVETLIRWAGDDPLREGLRDTPRRVVHFLPFCGGDQWER